MEIKYAWLKDVWEKSMMWPEKLPTVMNILDFLTKPAEDIQDQLNKLYSIVNRSYFDTYAEYQN
ncbi:unnamed protein product [Bathycoccus prasinos]